MSQLVSTWRLVKQYSAIVKFWLALMSSQTCGMHQARPSFQDGKPAQQSSMWPTEGISISIGKRPQIPEQASACTLFSLHFKWLCYMVTACSSCIWQLAVCREREKQRVKELSSTLQDLSARVHKHAIQDAETELLEEESEELQKLSCQLDIQLATLRQKAHANAEFSRPVSPLSPLVTRSSGDTTQGSLQSSTIPCSMTDPMQQHHTMYEAYEFLVRSFISIMSSVSLQQCAQVSGCHFELTMK